MRKRSKLMLLLGGTVIALGLVVCVVGAIIANADGDQLFAEKTEQGSVYTYPFSGDEINKITVDVTDAAINIIGGSERSYVEICNFNENYYSFSISNRLITLKESSEVSDLMRFWESGFTFKGMRYILKPGAPSGEKVVNIYLADADYVKNFTITTTKGKISASSLSSSTDYKLALDDGAVTLTDITTDSIISVDAPSSSDCDITLTNVSAQALNIKATQAELSSEKLTLGSGTLDITNGSAQIDFIPLSEYFAVKVNAQGKLTVNDVIFIDKYEFEKLPEGDTQTSEENAAQKAPEDIPTLAVTGRDLAVKITGECFGDVSAVETTD